MSVLDRLELLRGVGGRVYGFRGADIVQAMGNPMRMQARGDGEWRNTAFLACWRESGDLCQAFVSDKGRNLQVKGREDWGYSLGVGDQSNR